MTPRLRAEDTDLTVILSGRDKEILSVFESWREIPISKNSVLEGLKRES